MRLNPASLGFTLLLGCLAALPPLGIDMILPALSATGASLGVPASHVGLAMSVYLLTGGSAPLLYGPVSDRYGRKPVILFGCVTLAIASIGCATAPSLPILLAWRALQGAGAASMTQVLAIVRDLFEGRALHAKISHVVIATNIVPMLAPTLGAGFLSFGGWRDIYLVLAGCGFVLLLVISLAFAESARIDTGNRLTPAGIVRDYGRVLMHPVCRGYILVSAATMGVVFAYVTGSSLYFINVVGLLPGQYGLIFGATAVAVIAGAFLDGRIGASGSTLRIGLGLLTLCAASLLAMTLARWMTAPLVVLLMVGVTFCFGLIMPSVTSGAMQPLPQMAGAVGGAAGFLQMATAAGSSSLVAVLFDGRSGLAMSAVMTGFALLAAALHVQLVRGRRRSDSRDGLFPV
jgi:DHA1 family bicyclomycin/chloramphenicol resistance-like MFS transporter